jgi:hypothetical protein
MKEKTPTSKKKQNAKTLKTYCKIIHQIINKSKIHRKATRMKNKTVFIHICLKTNSFRKSMITKIFIK